MQMTQTRNENGVFLALAGRLDVNAADRLEEELKNWAPLVAVPRIVLDMSGLEYISSAGIRVLLSTHKNMRKGGELVIKSPSAFCKQVFEITGADIFLKITD